MNNSWTGGQYSFLRVTMAAYVLMSLSWLVAGESWSWVGMLPVAAIVPCALVMLGLFDRTAAIIVAVLLALIAVVGTHTIDTIQLTVTALLMLVHASLPAAPYGSLAARGRADPRGTWRMPPVHFALLWAAMAIAYSAWGALLLQSTVWHHGDAISGLLSETTGWAAQWLRLLPDDLLRLATWMVLALLLGFAALALVKHIRPWLWLAMVLVHLLQLALFEHVPFAWAFVMLHGFTFDPAWIGPKQNAEAETIYYDGHCGLCHRWVRFVLAEDRGGRAFRLAPLQSNAFERALPRAQREQLPDSIVVKTADGQVLCRSAAVMHIMAGLGGVWRIMAMGMRCVPRPIRDFTYDVIAGIRYRLFHRPKELCPLVPEALRQRFEP